MADSVTTVQKLYEKFVMLSRNSDKLSVVVVKSPPSLVVTIEDDDGTLIPIARLLDKLEIDQMIPNFDLTEKLSLMFHEALVIDKRVSPDEFGDGSVHPFFTEEFLNKVGI